VVSASAPAFSVPLTQSVSLWDIADKLPTWTQHASLPTADALGQYSGFTLYRTEVETGDSDVLTFDEVRDRAQVFFDRSPVGVLSRENHDRSLVLPASRRGLLQLLVEDQGRVDYGQRIGEPKGLIGPARVGAQTLGRWEATPLDLSSPASISSALSAMPAALVGGLAGPAFARAYFDLDVVSDLYLDTSGWGKGVVWINGFNLGRYWSRGPQHTLYVPGPLLRATGNELLVLELQASEVSSVAFASGPNLGHLGH
jgi:beta-galactosidase